MPNIFKFFSSSNAKDYVFEEVELQGFETDGHETEEPEAADSDSDIEPIVDESADEAEDSADTYNAIDYANIQADAILADARREADEFLEQAKKDAQIEAERIYEEAREAGRREGYAEGVAQALEEGAQKQEEQAAQMIAEVQRFLKKAGRALDRQLEENLDDLRDLAIAIAEKVISVSLRSSTDVIGRMVQSALDKRKHREWVYIYIAERDVKQMDEIPASLMSAVSGLSDRVRIIPMADDESGTCVIEMPEEIIDASVSTQLSNIRSLLTDIHQDADETINVSF